MRTVQPVAFKIAGIYLALSAGWIVVSDRLAADLEGVSSTLQTVKGLAFIALSALVIYLLVASRERKNRKIAAELKEARARAEAASASKTLFLRHMSHELRTPLNAVCGFSDILHQEMFGPLGASPYRDYARAIHESGTQLTHLVGTMIDVAAIEGGEVALVPETVDLAATVREALQEVALPGAADAQRLALPERAPVTACAPHLKQIVRNLIASAPPSTRASLHLGVVAEPRWTTLRLHAGAGGGAGTAEGVAVGAAVGPVEGSAGPAAVPPARPAAAEPFQAHADDRAGAPDIRIDIADRLARAMGGTIDTAPPGTPWHIAARFPSATAPQA